jgi:tRNA G10  N-methylase Trm11
VLPGQRILDPFCGTGTVAKAAQLLKLDYVGTDIKELAVKVSKERLTKVYDYDRIFR